MAKGVTIDIAARISGYEQSLAQLRAAIQKLDPGSALARSLNKGLAAAESQVKSLGKNLNPKFTNESQLDKFIEKINQVGAQVVSMGQQLEKVAKTDLNFSLMDGFSDLQKNLQELEAQLNSTYLDAFKNAVSSSKDLNEALQSIGFDVSKIESEQEVFNALKQKIDETSEATVKFGREYAKAAATRDRIDIKIKSLQGTIFGSTEGVVKETKNVHDIADDFLNIGNLRERVTQKLKEQFSNKEDLQKVIDEFFDGLDGSTARDKLQTLMNSLSIKKGDKRDFYKQIFGADDANARDIDQLIKWLNLPDIADVKSQLQQYTEQLAAAPKGISADSRTKILGFLSSNEIDQAVNELLKAISAAYKRVQDEIFRENNNLTAASGTANNAENALNAAIGKGTQLEQASKAAQKIADDLKNTATTTAEVRQVKEEVQQTSQTIDEMADKGAAGLREVGEAAEKAGKDFSITRNEAEGYNEALEKVHQREQLVGKIEGVVQRWFSIYAAVRMVGNAIRSVISTIKELDKTITDITIVTNMSREDLWGQMPQYTQMAQDYAVSISGVYQVSQLFYQQGLQTNDVLTLTGETLKMARIAGLDYAEATNYMTNALRSFKLEMDEASRVTDVYSILAANAAVSVSEIAEAMSKTASSAYAVGSSLENTATMITVMTEATRESASNIGSALKSIISRYGEMTSNPKQLIDSEGEEMSLNKVDRALQSVGITLQDTQGQFRNFDDVIMELASVWDSLDNNTQRYIATVMAGNRQQSRFLALVSSYERYAELSEKAANAAGAGQEQFEKTLEGIEARTQQLQTSLQNLYTSAGLEQLYGGLLGIADNILQYYNSISDAFGNGIQGAIAAVATFGAQFYNIANIVINVLKLIKANYTQTAKEIEILTELEAKKRAQIDLSEDEKKLYTMLANHRKFEADKTKESLQQSEIRATGEIKAFQKIKQAWNTIKNNKANIAYGIGTIGSIIGSTVGGETGNIISGTSGLIGAAGAFATGNYVGGILSLVTSFTSFASAIDTTSKALNEYNTKLEAAKEAQKKYIEAQKKATDSKNIVTDLNSEIKKLDELTAHRYDSVESQEAYQNQIQEIAKSYPELITYYDKEGKALDINIDKLKEYAENQEKIANQAIREAAIKRLQVDETLLEIDAMGTPSNVKGVAAGEITDVTNAFKIANSHIDETIDSIDELRAAIRSGAESLTGFTDHLSEQEIAQWYGISVSTDNDIRSALSAASLPYKSGASILDYIETPFAADEIENRNAFYDVWNNFWTYIKTNYSNQDFAEIDFTEAYDKYMEQFGQLTYDSQTSYMRATLVAAQKVLASKSSTSRFQSLTEQAIQDYVKTGGYESTLETIFVQNYLQKGLSENVLKGATITSENWQDYAKQVEEYLADEKNYPNLSKLFYGTASSEDRQKINEKILPEITKFSWPNLTSILSSMGVYEDTEAYVAIEEYWNTQAEYYLKLYDEYKTAANEELKKLLKDDYRENFSPEFLGTFTTGLSNIVDNKDNLKDQYDDALIAYSQLWDTLNELSTIAPETFATIQQLILTKGINSISGIFAIIDALPDFEGKDNLSGELQHLADYIVPKFGIEFDSMTDTLVTNFEGLTKAISNAQNGMNLSEATQMADGLNKKITDFSRIGTKYYFTDYMALADSYLESQEELAQYLFGRFDIEKVKPEDQERELEAFERANAARDLYYQAAREAYLAEGRIADFLESFNGYQDIDEDEITIRAMLAAGEIPEDLQAYATQLIEWYNSLGDDVYKVFMDSLSNGEMASIKVTDSNKDILSNEVFQDLIQGEIVLGETIVVNFAKATNAQLHNVYEYFANNQEISNKERESYLNTIDSELKSRNTQNIYKEVFNSYESFDRTMAEKFAKAVGNDLSAMNLTFDEVDRTFSMSIEQMKQYADELRSKGASPEVIAELTDIIQDAYKNVGDLITKGLEGTLSNAEGQQLIKSVKENFGIDISLQQLSSGLGVSRDTAIQLYTALNGVSSTAGQIVFDKLKDNLTAAGEECETIQGTLGKIKDLNDKINKGLDDQNKTLATQKKLYEDIAKSQMFDPKSYAFMSRSIPNALESPLTYFNDVGEAMTSLSSMFESGYGDPEKIYRILAEYNDLAKMVDGPLHLFNQELTGEADSLTNAWSKVMEAWRIVDGSAVIDLKKMGVDLKGGFEDAAIDMKTGLKALAAQQIEELTAIKKTFEAIQALESLEDEKKALLGKDGILDITDMFGDSGVKNEWTSFLTELSNATQNYKDKLNELITVTKDGQEIGIIDFLDKYGLSKEAIEAAIPEIKQLLSIIGKGIEFDDADPIGSLKKILADADPLTQSINLQAVLDVSGGTIQEAEQLMDVINKALAIDSTGNITIKGETANAAFTLDIQGKGATATLKLGDSEYKYNGPQDGLLEIWIRKMAKNYAYKHNLAFKATDPIVVNSISTSATITNDPNNSNIDINIQYGSKSGELGTVTVGGKSASFGANGVTAQNALEKATQAYVNESGLLTNYQVETKSADVTNDPNGSDVNVTITYTSKDGTTGYVQIGDKRVEFGPKGAILTADAALQKAAYDYDQAYGSGTLKDISLGGKTVQIVSANGVKYDFTFERDTQSTLADIGKEWGNVSTDLLQIIAAAEGSGVNLGGGVKVEKFGTTWTATVRDVDINGSNKINYKFTIKPEALTNQEELKAQWDDVGTQINELANVLKKVPDLPEGSSIDITQLSNGDYSIKINDINFGGNANVTYGFSLSSTDLTDADVWTSKINEIARAKEIYGKDLGNLATKLGINNFSLTQKGPQKGTLSVLMSLDGKTVVSCDYDIDWAEGTSPDKVKTDIANFEKEITELQSTREAFINQYDSSNTPDTTVDNPPIDLFPDPILFDASQAIKLTDEGYKVYNSKNQLIGSGAFATAEEAVAAALTEANKTVNTSISPQNNIKEPKNANGPIYDLSAYSNELQNLEDKEQYSNYLKQLEEMRQRLLTLSKANFDDIVANEDFANSIEINLSEAVKNWELPNFTAELYNFAKEQGYNVASITENLSDELTVLGEQGAEGYLEGLQNTETLTPAQQFIKNMLESVQTAQNSGSPAEEFIPLGLSAAEGYGIGLQKYDFSTAAGVMVSNLQQAIDDNLGLSFTSSQLKFNNLNATTSKNSSQSLYNIIKDLSETVKTGFDNFETVSSNFSNVLTALDNISSNIQNIIAKIPDSSKQFSLAELAATELKATVHGDFWGEGNQIVLSDGNGGNIHADLRDYITQFNQVFADIAAIGAENSPIIIDIEANTTPFISKLNDAISNANRRTATVKVGSIFSGLLSSVLGGGEAKGNVALAKGTLMGELGPELYVTGGHYYIAGRNGAEFINLPDDAIVFNHLQTKRLLGTGSSGRGTAVTNEKKATAHATGNVAMASASNIIAQIDKAIAAWKAIGDMSLKDFAGKAGSGGGGGSKNGLDKGYIADLERWYNLLRQIDKLEKDINYEEKLRSKLQSDRVANGAAIYESQKRSLESIEKEIAAHRELATLQESYYDARVKAFQESEYSRIFKFTDQGLMQYNDEDIANDSDLVGLFALAQLNATDINNQPLYTAKEQYQKLVDMGFGNELKYTAEGEAVDLSEDDGYSKAVEAFWDKLEGWKDELDDLYDSYNEQLDAILDNEVERNKLMQEIVDNQRAVEDKVLEAIENREQAIIDELQKERDAISEAADNYIDGLNQQLSKERDMYQRQESAEGLRKLRRQLAILERSGGSASQIANLREQIASSEQDQYFEAQQQQIDAIKEASDLEIERLDHQIEIMTETLAYQKENGLLWGEVAEIMAKNPADIIDFITKYSPDWAAASSLGKSEELREIQLSVEAWTAYYKDLQQKKDVVDKGGSEFDWNTYAKEAAKNYNPIWEENKDTAKSLFEAEFAKSGDPNAAWNAVYKYLNPLMAQYKKEHPEEFKQEVSTTETTTSTTSATADNQKRYYYTDENGQIRYTTNKEYYDQRMAEINGAKSASYVGADTSPVAKEKTTAKKYGYSYNVGGMYDKSDKVYNSEAEAIQAAIAAIKALNLTSEKRKQALNSVKAYSQGGLANYTGLAMLHGSKDKPEAILNAEQTAILRNDILGNSSNSLLSLLQDFRKSIAGVSNTAALSAANSIIIENANVNMNIDSIANDYDAQRAGEQALSQMLEIARKTSVQSMRR